MKPLTKLMLSILFLLALAGGAYWYLFFYGPGNEIPVDTGGTGSTGGFIPLNPPNDSTPTPTSSAGDPNNNQNGSSSPTTNIVGQEQMPALRLLSNSPIGGYGASTTASTTVVRWIDRGRGNVYEAKGDTKEITTLSNTVIPRIYESIWNKNITAFVGSLLSANTDVPSTVYAKLNAQATTTKQTPATSTSTATSTATTTIASPTPTPAPDNQNTTPYFLRGKNLPTNMLAYAVSPKGDRIFMLLNENGQGAGYTANFDGTSVSKIFIQPLTQVNIEWPEENTIAITTKATASQTGFLYFVNPKTAVWKKIIGPVYGLSTKVSKDAKYVLASGTGKDQDIVTSIYTVGTTTPKDAIVKTLAEKCTWGNYYKELIYCATPSESIGATYPDDWYRGTITSSDKIWQINSKTDEIRLVSSIINQSDRLINIFNISTDLKDDFLFFMNKDDLSFWSLDLNAR